MMTFVEGLLSFFSPCMLPLVPVYLIYMAGERGDKRQVLGNSCCFVLGFSAIFIALGVCAGSLGAVLAAHRQFVNFACAGVIALLGLSFILDIALPFKGMQRGRKVRGKISALIFGMVYALCLTPCVGAFLGAALCLAASEGGAWKGGMLLAEYSAGIAVPFLISALMLEQMKRLFQFFRQYARAVSVLSGCLLIFIAFGMALQGIEISFSSSKGNEGQKGEAEQRQEIVQTMTTEETKTMEVTLTSENFEKEVLQASVPVLVDFWAPWCGPCRMLAPEVESLAKEKAGSIKVGKVNVDENPELCARYGITSIPAIFVFKNGTVSAQSVGYQKKSDLEMLLAK